MQTHHDGGLHTPLRPARRARVGTALALSAVLSTAVPFAGAAQELTNASEKRFGEITQLTFRGENAEAYWAFDGSSLIFQSTPIPGEGCDQIYIMDPETGESRLVSTGQGRTTCSYYYPGGDRILYSSTHHFNRACPTPPDFSMGYVWAVYPSFDIFAANADGSDLRQLTNSFGYDAEATFSPTGHRIVFTSMRDGDLDLYSMLPDGSDVRRITDQLGYDGGAFYSPDGTKIVWRAHYPRPTRSARTTCRCWRKG